MKAIRNSALILVTFLIIGKGVGMADEIWLTNGDHISGTIVKTEDKQLIFKTAYAGEISIKWEDIANLKTDAPVKLLMKGDTTIEGIISPGENGKVTVQSDDIQEPIPIEMARLKAINPPPDLRTNIRLNVGASFTSGNTKTENSYGDGELVVRTKKNRYTLGATYKRSKDDDVTTTDSTFGYMKYDHFIAKKWFFYANASGEKDPFKDLDFRTTAGIGSGYQFFDTEKIQLSLEAGISYVNEAYIRAEDNDYAAGRWGLRFEYYFLQKKLQLFHYDTGLQSLENSDDLVIYTQTGFRVPLYKNLNSTIQFNYDYNNNPPPGTQNADKTFILTLGYQWNG